MSSFRIREGGLKLVDTAPSGGPTPTSVSFHDGLLYVLNAGVPNNVSGLTVSHDGELTPIAGSTRPLSGDNTAPVQVGFSDDGDVVIVSERATNRLVTYTVGGNGLLSAPTGPRTKAPSRVMDAVKEIELTDRTSELFRFEEKIRREEAKVAGKAETAVSRLDLQFEALVDEETKRRGRGASQGAGRRHGDRSAGGRLEVELSSGRGGGTTTASLPLTRSLGGWATPE